MVRCVPFNPTHRSPTAAAKPVSRALRDDIEIPIGDNGCDFYDDAVGLNPDISDQAKSRSVFMPLSSSHLDCVRPSAWSNGVNSPPSAVAVNYRVVPLPARG